MQKNLEDLQAELNCFFITAKRHDKDRVEVQFGFDGLMIGNTPQFSYITNAALFVPKSLGLVDFEKKIRDDIHSYVRLHTHVSNPKSSTSLTRVEERLRILRADPSAKHFQDFAIDFQGFLKASDKKIRLKLNKLARRKFNQEGDAEKLADTYQELQDVVSLVGEMRALESDFLNPKSPLSSFDQIKKDFELLEEYISHIIVQYLGDLFDTAKNVLGMEALANELKTYSRREALYRKSKNFFRLRKTALNYSQMLEQYPRRIAMLKKYFQRPLYIQDTIVTLENRLLIPVYAMAAAMAASWAIMVQLYQVQTVGERVGINTIAFITVAVFGYVAKDLLKDFMRKKLMTTGSKWLPTESRKLFLEKGKKKPVLLGRIGETFTLIPSGNLHPELLSARYSAHEGSISKIERSLGEDVLSIKKMVTLNLEHLDNTAEFPWGFREVVRIRLDRFMTQMDDPEREYYFLGKNALPQKIKTHRIYHLHLFTWIQTKQNPNLDTPIKAIFKAFLLTVDKTGILSCKPLEWEKALPPPTPGI